MGRLPADVEQARLADLSQHGSQLQPVLAPDEALYAAIPVRLDSDIKDPPSKLPPKDRPSSAHHCSSSAPTGGSWSSTCLGAARTRH